MSTSLLIQDNIPGKILSDSATLKWADFATEWLVCMTGSNKTITLPTPDRDHLALTLIIVNASATNCTLSGAFVAGASYVMPTKACVQIYCAKSAVGTYKWVPIGVTSSGNATSLSGVNVDSTSPTGELVQALMYSTAGTHWEPSTIIVPAAVIVPTLTWATATPTISSSVYRGNASPDSLVKWRFSIFCSDGKGATGLSVTFPAGYVPKDVDQIVPVKALVKVAAAEYTAVPAYIDAKDNTASNRVLTVVTGTLTNAATAEVHIVGEHEV